MVSRDNFGGKYAVIYRNCADFCVTFMLSLLVYHSNIEERKRSRLLEEKALLVENRTLLSIDKKQIIKVDYLDVNKENHMMYFGMWILK